MLQPKLPFLISLIAYTIVVRLIPYVLTNYDVQTNPGVIYYPWNFSPMTALCLFAAAFFADRRLSFVLPLATMFIGDLGIWLLTNRVSMAFHQGSAVTYLSFALAITMGMALRGRTMRRPALTALGLGVSFEVVYFLVSNLVWMYGSHSLYPQTWAGLIQCYTLALPFFGKSLAGTTAFTLLLFSPLGVLAATEEDEPTGELAHVRVK